MEGDSFWRALLPADVCHRAGFAPDPEALTDGELASLGPAGDLRRRQFAAGRWHARAALAALGVGAGELPRTSRGAPAWPAGVVGSIAHCEVDGRVFAVAVVARASAYAAIGIDVEPRRLIAPNDWPGLLVADELAAIAKLSPDARSLAVLQRWCAKEAAAKAAPGAMPDARRVVVTLHRDAPGPGAETGDATTLTFEARDAACSGRVGATPELVAAFCARRPVAA